MPAAKVFKIEQGVLALSLVDPAALGYADDWQAPGGKGLDTVTTADYTTAPAVGGVFSCQITSGALTASPNTTDQTTAATFCDPEVTTTSVGVTSYTLDAAFLQDPHVVAGLSRFLFEHDTKEAYFLLGLNGDNPPKAIGRLRVIAGQVGGDARVDLTATLSLPVSRKPDIEFGDATTSEIVEGGGGTLLTTSAADTSAPAMAGTSSE